MTHCLSPDLVTGFNLRHCEQTGEPHGLRDAVGLDRALTRPLSGFGDHEVFRTPVAKAGALLHSLVQDHPFIQCNKRTGWTAMTTFLALHCIEVDASDDDAFHLMMNVVTGGVDETGIALWVAERMIITP